MENAPRREDITSVFVGIRPLVKSANTKNTAAISRDYTIEFDESNLLTVTGGKWTTYRRMAEEAIDQAIQKNDLPQKLCSTENLLIHGFCKNPISSTDEFAVYGADTDKLHGLIVENPVLSEQLHVDLTYRAAEVIWATHFEMARTVEDVLARRTRILFLDARAAVASAPKVAKIMANELGKDENWIATQIEAFNQVAKNYLPF